MKHMFKRSRVLLALVFTFYDTTANFEVIGTYEMPDTIIRIDDEGGRSAANTAVDAEILAAVAEEFDDLGYVRVFPGNATPPDVVVFLTANRTDLSYWIPGGWWGYWGYYPWYPGWGPGYGPGYPWSPGYVGTQSTGTLLITMLEGGPSNGTEIPAIWAGALNGLLQGSDASILSRMRGLIARAFNQSPYL